LLLFGGSKLVWEGVVAGCVVALDGAGVVGWEIICEIALSDKNKHRQINKKECFINRKFKSI
jgi:hypothetical protein